MAKWCTIESDPGVFEEMIAELGVNDVQVQEVYGLDYDFDFYNSLNPIYGFIFLFKWQESNNPLPSETVNDSSLFFSKQVVHDACATQAILSVLLNNEKTLHLGENLQKFRDFVMDLDSYSRGLSIGESDFIRKVHNSFGIQKFVQVSNEKNVEKEDAFHFIAYILHNGKIVELDGLRESAHVVPNSYGAEHWSQAVLEHISSKIKAYNDSEIRFTLLTVVEDKKKKLQDKIKLLEKEIVDVEKREEIQNFKEQIIFYEEEMKSRELEIKARKEENARRRHNYMPLIFSLLDSAAKAGKLESLLTEAYNRIK